jgi:hypothetical protein
MWWFYEDMIMSEDRLTPLLSLMSTLGINPEHDELEELFSNTITKIDPNDYSTLLINKYLARLGREVIPANVPSLVCTILHEIQRTAKTGDIVLFKTPEGFTKLGILLECKEIPKEIPKEETFSKEESEDESAEYPLGKALGEPLKKSLDRSLGEPLIRYRVLTMTEVVTHIVTLTQTEVLKILW